MTLPRLHLVTDDGVLRDADFVDRAARAIDAGGAEVALHLRGHDTPGGVLYRVTDALTSRSTDTRVLVNDRVDVALAAPVAGVQLGRRSLPIAAARALLGAGRWIGYSAHAPEEAEAAEGEGADFIVLGTVFATRSHPGREPAGVERVRRTAARAGVPVLAIGGVTPERVGECMAAGAWGVAVLSGVWRAQDPAAAVGRYLDAIYEGPS